MKKRSTTALLAALAVVAAGVFVSLFLSFSNQDPAHVITLPGQGSAVIDTAPEIEEENRQMMQQLTVDATNVQSVIASLSRPENYQSQSELTYFYRDTQHTVRSQLWKLGNRIRTSQLAEDGSSSENAILTDAWVYLWGGDSSYVRFAREEQDADLYSRTPNYEDVLQLSSTDILAGEIREIDGRMCISVTSKDPLTGEQENWCVLVENGLLLYADGTLDGVPTYAYRMTELQLEQPDEALFLLPDGTVPQ